MYRLDTISPEAGQYLHLVVMDVHPLFTDDLSIKRISVSPVNGRTYRVYIGLSDGKDEVVTIDKLVHFNRRNFNKTSCVPVFSNITYEETSDGFDDNFLHIELSAPGTGDTLLVRMPSSDFLRRRVWYGGTSIGMSPWEIRYSTPLMFQLSELLNSPEHFRKVHLPGYSSEQVAQLVHKIPETIGRSDGCLAILRKARVKQLTLQELARKYRVDSDKRELASFIDPED
jgi:hypothetical protein